MIRRSSLTVVPVLSPGVLHTDNVGNAAANQDLSQRRAAAVQAYPVAKHGIDSSRLNSAGFGDKKPAAPNTSTEGRQQNRRVELVKI